jgi:hypothetical protein
MAIYDFFLSRNNGPTLANYVGHTGRLFYDDATGEIRISDGTTAGGLPIPITVATSATAGSVKPGAGFTVDGSGTLTLNAGPMFELDESNVFQLKAGTADRIGGIKAGEGVNIASDGTLAINLDDVEAFSFGDFVATVGLYSDEEEYALLSSIKEDEDIVVASNGTGTVCVVGAFEIHATNGDVTGSLETEPFFKIKEDGQVRILVPLADSTEGGVEIIGSTLGTSLEPGIAGTMLHLTGNADLPTRVYHDTLGEYSSYVFRRYNGSVITPTAVLANQDIGRINFTAATDAGMGNVATAQISVTALENQTTTAQGSKITFTVTPVGSSASSRVNVATITTADGVTATKFTGPLTGDVTGTASTATNLAAATGILAGVLNIDPNTITRSTASVQTFTLTGLTTNHKIVITSGTAFGYGLFISAAWASATNTLSIEFQNFLGNQDVNLPPKDIQYFAWV